MRVEQVPMLTRWSLGYLPGLLVSIPARSPKCAQARNFAQGSALPKRDIVDTTFHASAKARPSATSRSALPTMWERDRRLKSLIGCKHVPLVGVRGHCSHCSVQYPVTMHWAAYLVLTAVGCSSITERVYWLERSGLFRTTSLLMVGSSSSMRWLPACLMCLGFNRSAGYGLRVIFYSMGHLVAVH